MKKTFLWTVQLVMILLSVLFWILDWIPIVNIFSNIIYWIIWLIVFLLIYFPLLIAIAKNGVAIGAHLAFIYTISAVAFILGCIPLISIIPWKLLASFLTHGVVLRLQTKSDQLTAATQAIKKKFQANQVKQPRLVEKPHK